MLNSLSFDKYLLIISQYRLEFFLVKDRLDKRFFTYSFQSFKINLNHFNGIQIYLYTNGEGHLNDQMPNAR